MPTQNFFSRIANDFNSLQPLFDRIIVLKKSSGIINLATPTLPRLGKTGDIFQKLDWSCESNMFENGKLLQLRKAYFISVEFDVSKDK